jgi:excisionase family DNA binding protein
MTQAGRGNRQSVIAAFLFWEGEQMDIEQTLAGELLRTAECARFLKVSENTIRHWRRTGTGPPFIRIGDQVRYNKQAVLEWLEERQDHD